MFINTVFSQEGVMNERQFKILSHSQFDVHTPIRVLDNKGRCDRGIIAGHH